MNRARVRVGLRPLRDPRGENGELVVADAPDELGAGDLLEARGHLPQHAVARAVPDHDVHAAEGIEVHEHEHGA